MSEDNPNGTSEADKPSNFLSRWSQRKRAAIAPGADVVADRAGEPATVTPAPTAETETEAEFDLSSLPKLEDLTDTTDITGFLRKGVPESLRNAALRKSWALDPAIRNYVNPALDYAFDWNTPGGVPGSSELAAGTDIAKMVLQIMGSDSATSDPEGVAAEAPDAGSNVPRDAGVDDAPQDVPLNAAPQQVRLSAPAAEPAHDQQAVLVTGEMAAAGESAPQQAAHRHGGARPKV